MQMNEQEKRIYKRMLETECGKTDLSEEEMAVWKIWRGRAAERREYFEKNNPKQSEEAAARVRTGQEFYLLLVYNLVVCYPANLIGYYRSPDYGLAILSILTVLFSSSPLLLGILKKRKDFGLFYFKYFGVKILWFITMRLPFLNENHVMRSLAKALNSTFTPKQVVVTTLIVSLALGAWTLYKQTDNGRRQYKQSNFTRDAYFDWLSDNAERFRKDHSIEPVRTDLRNVHRVYQFIRYGFLYRTKLKQVSENGDRYEVSMKVVDTIADKINEEAEENKRLMEELEN